MASKLKTDILETVSGSGTIALTNQLSGMTAASVPAGSVLQVLSTTKTDTTVSSSSSFIDIPSLSVTITPTSASSKIMVFMHVSLTCLGNTMMLQLMRDSTGIGVGDAAGSRAQSTVGSLYNSSDTNHQQVVSSANYLDSPSTTAATTYKVRMKTQGAAMYVNRSSSDPNNSSYGHRSTSTITVMEIKG